MTNRTAIVGEGDGTVQVSITRTAATGTLEVICYTVDGL